ncbi:MAG: hypothetical protein ACP6IU_04685 [Candidatus Asgardarchaeia archaeon]
MPANEDKIEELKKALKIKVESFSNLIRLAVTWATHRAIPMILYFKSGNKHIYATFSVISSYYDFHGLLIVMFYESDKEPEGVFIAYSSDPKEEWMFKNAMDERKYQYIPIIKLAEPLPFY